MRGLPDSDRLALLFDNVVGNRGESYEMSVLTVAYGASDEISLLKQRLQNVTAKETRFWDIQNWDAKS